MASSFPFLTSHTFLLLLLSLTYMVAHGNIIEDTCKAYDRVPPNYCRQCLNTYGRDAKTQKGVATTLLDCAVVTAADARDKAAALSAKDKVKMPKCVQGFTQAHDGISGALNAMQRNDMLGGKIGSVRCIEGFHDCVNAFETPGQVPEPVNSPMRKLKGLCTASYNVLAKL